MRHSQSHETPKWLTESQVSEITGLSVSSIQKQRFHQRGISYCKIGRSVRYHLQDVESFMQARRIELPRV